MKIFLIIVLLNKMGKKILRKGKKPSQALTELYDVITHIQTDILDRIQRLKLSPKFRLCPHLYFKKNTPGDFSPEVNYFDRYWRRFIMNEVAKLQIRKLDSQLIYFSKKMQKIQELFKSRQQFLQPFERRKGRDVRRQPSSNYRCTICRGQFEDVQALFSHREKKHEKKEESLMSLKLEQNIYESAEDSESRRHLSD